jgi:hydroxymethylglutaryl-CoA synthase
VGLAQNFGALRALAIEGIQKGHMMLHGRAIAVKLGVPNMLLEECCRYMSVRKKYDEETVRNFVEEFSKPRL